MTVRKVLIIGGGDIGSAVAHVLFRGGLRVLISERAGSPHARRGMAFTDALFDGRAMLEGVEARCLADIDAVQACWESADAVPIVVLDESLLAAAIHFDVVVDATMKRNRVPADLRGQATLAVGLGPGYVPGVNCHVAIETQWGDALGQVLYDRPAAERSGGPRALAGVTRARFAIAPCAGVWQTTAVLGADVVAGSAVGHLGEHIVRAPIAGQLRGLARAGVEVLAGQRLVEVDPRSEPQIIGLGERPLAIATGVAEALDTARRTRSEAR